MKFCVLSRPLVYLSLFPMFYHLINPTVGEGNGSPLQCSCLENPRDGAAWWAAVYGVAQSRTRLKRLSSSSSKPIVSKAWSILGFSWVRAVPIPWGSTWRSQQGLAGSCPFWCCHMQTAHLAPSDLTFCGELAKQRLSLGLFVRASCSDSNLNLWKKVLITLVVSDSLWPHGL